MFKKFFAVAAIFLSVLIGGSGGGFAQGAKCFPYEYVVTKLAEEAGEYVQYLAVTADGNALNIFVNPEKGSYTAVIYFPNGAGCIVSSGTDFDGADGKKIYEYQKKIIENTSKNKT